MRTLLAAWFCRLVGHDWQATLYAVHWGPRCLRCHRCGAYWLGG